MKRAIILSIGFLISTVQGVDQEYWKATVASVAKNTFILGTGASFEAQRRFGFNSGMTWSYMGAFVASSAWEAWKAQKGKVNVPAVWSRVSDATKGAVGGTVFGFALGLRDPFALAKCAAGGAFAVEVAKNTTASVKEELKA